MSDSFVTPWTVAHHVHQVPWDFSDRVLAIPHKDILCSSTIVTIAYFHVSIGFEGNMEKIELHFPETTRLWFELVK